jgi:excisionase family DNA binding protein
MMLSSYQIQSPTDRLILNARGTPTAYVDVATEKILTIPEVAKRLGMHPVTVYRLAKEGRLPVFRVGRMLRFDADELEQWIRAGKVPASRRRHRKPLVASDGEHRSSEKT